ncbi:MAG: hypothetical protein AAGA93_05685 [Actinomycetota bacterium]
MLIPEVVRHASPSELDFFGLDRENRAEVEVVLGELGNELEQDFIDHLEAWNVTNSVLEAPRPPTEVVEPEEIAWVLRLCYRIEWDGDQDQAKHWVDYPGQSDPDVGVFVRIPYRLHRSLPVVAIGNSGAPLRLGARADFRKLLDKEGVSVAEAFEQVVQSISAAGETLAKSKEIGRSVGNVLSPVEGPLGVDEIGDGILQFVPDGGSLTGVLRTLQPAIDLGGPGHLPLARHGSSTATLVQHGEAIAALAQPGSIVLSDDFGENLDPASTKHVASVLRGRAAQAWLATRRAPALEAFPLESIVRLHVRDGMRQVAQLERPRTKAERVAARHVALQLLPAVSASTIVLVEGPHDRAALDAYSARRFAVAGEESPATYGIRLADGGAADGSGGTSAVARLSSLAARLGFHTVAVIDGDRGAPGQEALRAAAEAADRVVRLPDGVAIEKALTHGIPLAELVDTLELLAETYDLQDLDDLSTLSEPQVAKLAIKVLKKNGGLHAQFVELLPDGIAPQYLEQVVEAVIESGKHELTGVKQL